MVQLKVSRKEMRAYLLGVSIPNGSIKSVHNTLPYVLHSVFQFLMVQLKELSNIDKQRAHQVFQFLMVQLKVGYIHHLKIQYLSFNS